MSRRFLGVAASIFILAGCQSTDFSFGKNASFNNTSAYKSIPQDKITSDQRKLAAEGVNFLDKSEYKKANQSFNKALKLDIENSYLQFLNGLSYHLLALKGDSSMFSLAEQGYELAIQFDPSNWIAHYHLGLLYLDQRKFVPAQEKFSEAALFINDDPDIFYSLAVASYYAQDPVTAAGALERARQLDPQNENVLKASSVIMAALGQSEKASEFKDDYILAAVSTPTATKTKQLSRRLLDWQSFHSRQGGVLLTQKMDAVPVIAVETKQLPSVVEANAKEKTAKELQALAEVAKAALEKAKMAVEDNPEKTALMVAKGKAAAANRTAQAALHDAQAKATAELNAANATLQAAKVRISTVTAATKAAIKAAEIRAAAAQKEADDAVADADKAAADEAPDEIIRTLEQHIEVTAIAADKVIDEIDAAVDAGEKAEEASTVALEEAEEAVSRIEEEGATAIEAAEEAAAAVEEEGANAVEAAEEVEVAVEEKMTAAVEAAEEVASAAIEKAEAATEAAAEAAEVAIEDVAIADETAKEAAVAEAEAAAERASAALELATNAAAEAEAAAEKATEIAQDEPSTTEQAIAAKQSAMEAAAALEDATAATEVASNQAEKTSSKESATAAIAASNASKKAALQAVKAANKALEAAQRAIEQIAAAKKVATDIAFFKDLEIQDDQEEVVPDENKMVIVDVVIIRTEEDNTTSKGVNLLNGLTIQFGGGLTTTSAYGVSNVSVKSNDSAGLTRTITRAINIPSITYSLNIANTATERNEILARPTLIALAGQESRFFSGIGIDATAVGGSSSTPGSTVHIDKRIGVALNVTPEFLEDGRVKLAVNARRTFLATPNSTSITYSLRVDTSETNVTANVAMNFGETLILSGLSEKETERVSTGVPFLQDIPGVQYFFSNRTTRDFQKSVLILLTPRPPNYIQQTEKGKEQSRKTMNKDERVLSELQARYSDWFKPYPNWASVFNHLQENSLYREFRTGDVSMEKWEDQSGFKGRLKKAMEFLYH